MKRLFIFIFIFLTTVGLAQQSGDIMYFAERADGKREYGLSDRFTTGSLSVICKLIKPPSEKHIFVQLDKYNMEAYTFNYYQKYEFWQDPNRTYLYFNNIVFNSPGIYRVFLLNEANNTITSALVDIVELRYLQNKTKK